MLKKVILFLLVGLSVACVPFRPGRVVTLKVCFRQYACAPCRSAQAFEVVQVYDPANRYLLHKDIILYYQGQYLPENNQLWPVVFDEKTSHPRLVRVLGKLHRRSLFDKVTGAMYEADVYKLSY